jgi:hypothetical protein
VFRLTPPASGEGLWTEEVLHSFTGVDGQFPLAPVTLGADGSVYGTTTGGGVGAGAPGIKGDGGTVFKLANTAGWPVTVLHNFGPYKGNQPFSGVVFNSDGLLYGATSFTSYQTYPDTGIIYSVSPQGDQVEYEMAHVFGKGSDGVAPVGLTVVPPASINEFVGATAASANYPNALGNIYTLKTGANGRAVETIVYSFQAAPDVSGPMAPPIGGTGALHGGYFGMAEFGGTHNQGGVYSVVPDGDTGGIETVLYNFGDQFYDPQLVSNFEGATLVQSDKSGQLVGTTNAGGTKYSGTFFEVDPPAIAGGPWTEKVDVNFDSSDPTGGGSPLGALLKVGHTYYGALSDTPTGEGAIYELTH